MQANSLKSCPPPPEGNMLKTSLISNSVTLLPISELRLNDEFESFYETKFQRVRVASRPEITGNTARFKITAASRKGEVRSTPVQFLANSEVVVLNRPRNRPVETQPSLEILKREELKRVAIEALTQQLQSVRQIGNSIRHQIGAINLARLEPILRDLEEPVVYKRFVGKVLHYRRAIEFYPGLAVVENLGFPTQRYGWVEAMQISRQRGTAFPVIRWLDGTRSFSSNDLLEIVTDTKILNRIEQARTQSFPEGFIEIPYSLLKEFKRNGRDGAVLLEIAKRIGVVSGDRQDLKGFWQVRGKVCEFLDRFYPEILEVKNG